MALWWPSFLLLLITAYSTHADAAGTATPTFTPELTSFIPSCARECFKSFLNSNYPTNECGTNPTLDCLCETASVSGYTVGEGAVQCIISEITIGYCKGDGAKDSVVIGAYTMCNGNKNALPNTHGTITATLNVQTSMPSVVIVAPGPTSGSNFSKTGSLTASRTRPTTSLPSTLATATWSTSSSIPTETATKLSPAASATDAPPVADSEASKLPPPLTKPQIVGISLGTAGGVALIAGCLVFFACRRRKSRRDRDSDLLPFQLDPETTSTYHNKKNIRGPGATFNGVAGKIPPKIPPRLDISSPNMFSRRSIKPDTTIGLALSPESKQSQAQREHRTSRLLPDKPMLSLKLPGQADQPGLSFSQPPLNSSQGGIRQSTATQFEEDFHSADTAVAADDSWGRGSTDKMLEPSTGTLQTIRVVNPTAPPAAFIGPVGGVDKWRYDQANSMDNTTRTSPDYYVKPLNLTRGPVGSFSQPRQPNAQPPSQKSQQPQQPQTTMLNAPNRPATASSSLYSPVLPPGSAGLPTIMTTLPSNDTAPPIPPRNRRSVSYRTTGPYDRRESAGSQTSFESNDSTSPQDWELESNSSRDRESKRKTTGTVMLDLSPVVESPRSPVDGGISPVSYPRIPGRGRLTEGTMRLVPPPNQPNFQGAMAAGSAMGAVINNSSLRDRDAGKPWRQAEMSAQAQRERESLGMGLPTHPQAERFGPPLRGYSQGPGQARQQPQQQRRQSREYIAPSARFNMMPTSAARSNAPPQQQQYRPYPYPQSEHLSKSLAHQRNPSEASQSSTSSSLLAKRLGTQKAAALALRTQTGDMESRSITGGPGGAGKWRVLDREEIERAKMAGWKPSLSASAKNGGGSGHDNTGYETESGSGWGSWGGDNTGNSRLAYVEREALPRTPGWVPKLTPTRRGDELFLSVQ